VISEHHVHEKVDYGAHAGNAHQVRVDHDRQGSGTEHVGREKGKAGHAGREEMRQDGQPQASRRSVHDGTQAVPAEHDGRPVRVVVEPTGAWDMLERRVIADDLVTAQVFRGRGLSAEGARRADPEGEEVVPT
jgi:hypothetical protein